MTEERKCMYCQKKLKCDEIRGLMNCILNEYGLEIVATGKK